MPTQPFKSRAVLQLKHSGLIKHYGANAVSVNRDFSENPPVPKQDPRSKWLKQLGDNIRRERMAKGISHERLADLADLNIRNVQRIEAGEIDALFSTIARIRKGLGCSWNGLIPNDENLVS